MFKEGEHLMKEGLHKEAVDKFTASATEFHRVHKITNLRSHQEELQNYILNVWDWSACALQKAGLYQAALNRNLTSLEQRLLSDEHRTLELTLRNRRR